MSVVVNLSTLRVCDTLKSLGITEIKNWRLVTALQTFEEPPSPELLRERAVALASIAKALGASAVFLCSPRSPYILGFLEEECKRMGMKVYYPFFKKENGKSVIKGLVEK